MRSLPSSQFGWRKKPSKIWHQGNRRHAVDVQLRFFPGRRLPFEHPQYAAQIPGKFTHTHTDCIWWFRRLKIHHCSVQNPHEFKRVKWNYSYPTPRAIGQNRADDYGLLERSTGGCPALATVDLCETIEDKYPGSQAFIVRDTVKIQLK